MILFSRAQVSRAQVSRVLALSLLLAVCAACSQEEADTPALVSTCLECHNNGGAATVPGWPPLTSFNSAEIEGKLEGYRSQANPDSRMSDVAHDFSDEDIRQLARYYGRDGTR